MYKDEFTGEPVFRSKGLRKLSEFVKKMDPGVSPGWISFEVEPEVQRELNVGPHARMRPDLQTGKMEVNYGPKDIKLTPTSEEPRMESLVPCFTAFSRGQKLIVPRSLSIRSPDDWEEDTSASINAEKKVIERLLLRTRPFVVAERLPCLLCGGEVNLVESARGPHAELHGRLVEELFKEGEYPNDRRFPAVIFQNPSLMVLSMVMDHEDPRILCAEDYYDRTLADVLSLRERKQILLRTPPRVRTFPYGGEDLVYTGSLGAISTARHWIGLIPDPFGPNVVGMQHYEWGISFQYQRKDRYSEIVYEFSPLFYRYTTKEYFGIESDYYVQTTEKKRQYVMRPGVGPLIGFTNDPSPRYNGRLGRVLPVGKFVLRLDTIQPERHDLYYVDGPFANYGACFFPKKDSYHVFCLESMRWLDLTPKEAHRRAEGTLATFFDAEGNHQEELFSSKFGAVLSPSAALEYDRGVAAWFSGSVLKDHQLPRPMKEVTRDRAKELMSSGLAYLENGVLNAVPKREQLIVGSVTMTYREFFSSAYAGPMRGVLLTHQQESFFRRIGFVLGVSLGRRFTLFYPRVPLSGWALSNFDTVSMLDFTNQ